MMDDHDDQDEQYEDFYGQTATKEEAKIANILLHGTPAAKQEIIIKLIYLGHIPALTSVLNTMSDQEYRRVVPTA